MGKRRVFRRLAIVAAVLGAGFTGALPDPAHAVVTAVKGSACGYITNVGLFGGPQAKLGCPPQVGTTAAPATAGTLAPSVTLPQPNGSAVPITAHDPDGAAGIYGPATIFGGRWPCVPGGNCPAAAGPSGPMTVSTVGTPAGGTVTSTADINLFPTAIPVRCFGEPAGTTNCTSPGGFGPFPVEGDSMHVECSASETSRTGSTTIVNGQLARSTDSEGEPIDLEAVPVNPPPNYTRHGVITNVGDVFSVVYNEQIINSDGSITVNGAHMYLYGPTAIGEVIKGQVTCGTTPAPPVPPDTTRPTCGIPVVEPNSPEDPTPRDPRRELIGVFDAGNGDAGGLNQITNVQSTNANVAVGVPGGAPYAQFLPPQRGPLQITATRINQSLPMSWSFDAVDAAGNSRKCRILNGNLQMPLADFDADGDTDISIFRPAGYWFFNGQAFAWGTNGDIPTPGDYDGDGDTDMAVFRPSNGLWFIHGAGAVAWGGAGDIPVPGDYDGDLDTDIAVFRNGVWFIQGSPVVSFGVAGDIPVPGDYDGDGDTDIAVFRNGVWMIDDDPDDPLDQDTILAWGTTGDIPVPGDYDADGDTDLAVYRNGIWFIQGAPAVVWGTSGDIPAPGDYDGDGDVGPAVFRPSNGLWFIHGGPTVAFGASGDVPLPLPDAIRRFFFPPL